MRVESEEELPFLCVQPSSHLFLIVLSLTNSPFLPFSISVILLTILSLFLPFVPIPHHHTSLNLSFLLAYHLSIQLILSPFLPFVPLAYHYTSLPSLQSLLLLFFISPITFFTPFLSVPLSFLFLLCFLQLNK